jgi:hypothetical protein
VALHIVNAVLVVADQLETVQLEVAHKAQVEPARAPVMVIQEQTELRIKVEIQKMKVAVAVADSSVAVAVATTLEAAADLVM